MRTTDFFFLIFLWVLSLFTPYRRHSYFLFFLLIAFNILHVVPMYIPRPIEGYKQDVVKPGNVVSTFRYLTNDPHYLFLRFSLIGIHGYAYMHTAIAVEYKGRTYMLNTALSDMGRSTNSYRDQIETVATMGKWMWFLEPLEAFLEDETLSSTYLNIMDTGRHITYDPEIVSSVSLSESNNTRHCAYLAAKYLDEIGLCRNSSAIPDFLYYTPEYFARTFPQTKQLQL